jgi:zinc transporter, ZIP family
MMGFGAGTLLSAVAYELVPESSLAHGWKIAISFLAGAFAYYVGDRLIDKGGGAARTAITEGKGQNGSGAAMMMLADSMMPEAFRHGGRAVGLLTVIGFLVAGVLTVLQ